MYKKGECRTFQSIDSSNLAEIRLSTTPKFMSDNLKLTQKPKHLSKSNKQPTLLEFLENDFRRAVVYWTWNFPYRAFAKVSISPIAHDHTEMVYRKAKSVRNGSNWTMRSNPINISISICRRKYARDFNQGCVARAPSKKCRSLSSVHGTHFLSCAKRTFEVLEGQW